MAPPLTMSLMPLLYTMVPTDIFKLASPNTAYPACLSQGNHNKSSCLHPPLTPRASRLVLGLPCVALHGMVSLLLGTVSNKPSLSPDLTYLINNKTYILKQTESVTRYSYLTSSSQTLMCKGIMWMGILLKCRI